MLSSITPQRYLFDKQGNIKELDSLVCKTIVSPQKYADTTKDSFTCTTHVQPQIFEIPQDEYNKYREVCMAETPKPLKFAQANQYYVDSTHGVDPGVVAVANALFTSNSAFQNIPIKNTSKIFRRRRRGEPASEWSNAFVTRIDPCECVDPEEEYKPYEMTKIYDTNGVKTVFNFNNDSYNRQGI